MRKKILAILMSITVCFVFTACSSVFNYDMSQYVKVGEYKGLKYDESKLQVSKAEVDKAIKEDLSKTSEAKWVTEGVVEDGDTVNIDYSGEMDGKTAEGTVAEDQELEIGSGSFIDGFESGLVGKKIGEKVVLNLHFPKEYPNKPSYAGKAVAFTVTINKAKKSVTPKLTDKWVKKNTSFESVKEYKAKVKDDLYQEKLLSVGSGLLVALTDKAKIKAYPDKELDALVETAVSYYKQLAAQNNTTYEDLLAGQMGIEKDAFEAQLKEEAKTEIGQELVAYYIAKKEGLEAKKSDVKKYVDDLIKANGLDDKAFKKQTGMSKRKYIRTYKNDIMIAITVQNVEKFLVENGK
ncbi:MAG: FKBP-type peptidyl-prolyl cis-trans isomerase [Clostridia bacterium]|nr:FKBP-type peptidyl-prolyl cis-trans isomerase [Clostridia bacterium]